MSLRTIVIKYLALAICCVGVSHAQGNVAAESHSTPGIYDPVANPRAYVTEGHARFTVLTPQLIRMEWALDGKFENRPSFTFLNRNMPVPEFEVTRGKDGLLILRTSDLKLTYRDAGTSDGHFTAENLSVFLTLDGKNVEWHPCMPDSGNLLGTTRTLDRVNGDKLSSPLTPGLISRNGWAVIDDTTQPLFTSDNFSFSAGEHSPLPWVVRRSPGDRQDWYFFGYGHDYKRALGDFVKVAGRIPLPPRYAFGAWWTRYWAYTDLDLDDLMRAYNDNNVPLDVLVIDMDWHTSQAQLEADSEVDQSGQKLGWTGYTWNKMLFPYPTDFLQGIHLEGLKIALNLHPASGVQPWEASYPAMARALGIDPSTKKYVPFDILSQKFTRNYMDILHHPLEKEGVDFWWLDWQQAATTNTPGVDSTWWLNYVHFSDQQREGKRPLLMGRYGGLGNHRYQVGFSGDVLIGWSSLAFQPWFTATAANVGYAYWSHDLGGHVPGPTPPELYARWVQFGAFSPIFRTHVAKSPYGERRIWAYPEPYSDIMRATFQQRYALLPYLYTEGRRTYDTGVAFVRPLYYDWPEAADAYNYKNEYQFGEEMVVAPVTQPVDAKTQLATVKTWIPPGEWIEAQSYKHFTGPLEVESSFAIDEVPRYVRAGAIVPMAPPMLRSNAKPVDPLIVQVYPLHDGRQSTYTLYDDGSDGEKYERGEDTWTKLTATQSGADLKIHIAAIEGHYPGMPEQRGYEIRLPDNWPPAAVTANGRPLQYQEIAGKPGWRYNGSELMTIVTVPHRSVHQALEVDVHVASALVAQRWKLDGVPGVIRRLRAAQHAMNQALPVTHPPDVLDDALEMGDRLTYHPETAEREIDHLLEIYPAILPAVEQAQKGSAGEIHAAVKRLVADDESGLFRQRQATYAHRLTESVAAIQDSARMLPRRY